MQRPGAPGAPDLMPYPFLLKNAVHGNNLHRVGPH